jgi:hypothetical protein
MVPFPSFAIIRQGRISGKFKFKIFRDSFTFSHFVSYAAFPDLDLLAAHREKQTFPGFASTVSPRASAV